MIKFQLFFLASFLTVTCLFSQNLDSLNELSKQLICRDIQRSDSIADRVIKSALESNNSKALGYAYKNKATNGICSGNLTRSIRNFDVAIKYLRSINDLKGVASTINNQAIAYYRIGYLDSAKFCRNRQIELGLQLMDTLVLAAAYQGVSGIFLDQSKNDSCIYFSLKGLEMARKANLERVEGQFLVNIGAAHFQSKNYDKALISYREARPILEKVDDIGNLGNLYHNMAGIYEKVDLDSSLYYMNKGVEIHKKTGDIPHLAYNYQGIGDIYFKKGDYLSAIEYNKLAMGLNVQTGQLANQVSVLKNLANCYTKIGSPNKGIPFLYEAIEIANREGFLQREAESYLNLSKALEAIGDFKKAYQAHIKYSELSDNYLNETKNSVISELQTKYETEKKDQEIATLSQQAQINELQLKQRNTQLFGAGVVLLVLILGGIVINQRRNFRHKQTVAEIEQRVLRLQMNPHFIFNALTSIQNYIVQSNTKESVVYLAKFSKLMRQILEHSRQEFITVEDEADMLRNYIEIQQLRFKDIFDFVIEVDPKIDRKQTKIPPLFAQPFVENAIEHGFKGKENGGKLIIRFNEEGQKIGLQVIDNGSGIAIPNPEQTEHRSLATAITRERLSLLNKRLKDVFYLEVKSNLESGGTTAKLLLPTLQIS